MKPVYFLLFAFGMLLFAGCQDKPHQLTIVEKKEIQKEVQDKYDQMIKAINKLDARAWSEFMRKDGFISAFLGTEYYGTRKDYVEVITGFFSERDKQKVEPTAVQVTALSMEHALLTSEEVAEVRLNNGQMQKFKHVFTLLWKKEIDGWKIIHVHEAWQDIK